MAGRFVQAAWLLWSVIGISGLLGSTLATATEDSEAQALRARAQAYWDNQVKGDWAAVFPFLYPADRINMSVEQFVTRQQSWMFRYLAAEVVDAAVANNLGWVQVNYTIEFKRLQENLPALEPKRLQVWEPWEKRDAWYVLSTKEQRERVPSLPPRLRPAAEEAVLARRVEEFWQARQALDWAQAYQYLEPAYREQVSKETFLQRKPYYTYLSHGLAWVEVIGDEGRARVRYTAKINDPSLAKLDPQEKEINENWIKVDGQWYLQTPR